MEAERLAFLEYIRNMGVDRKQVGELASEQRFGIALEILGQLTRNVGQGAKGIGFPEPAAAGVLELIDKMEGLARLRFELEPNAARRNNLARSSDAVSDQHQGENGDAGRNQRGIAEDDRRQGADERVHQRQRWGADRNDRSHADSGAKDDLRGGNRSDEGIVLDRMAEPRPQQPAERHVGAQGAHHDVRWKVEAAPSEQRRASPAIHEKREQRRDQRVVERESRRDSVSEDEISDRKQEMREAEQHGCEIEARDTPFGKRLLVAAVGL